MGSGQHNVSFFPARQVLSGLYIGSKADAQSAAFMRSRRIGLVVNCTRDIPNYFENRAYGAGGRPEYLRVGVHDAQSENGEMLRLLPRACTTIDRALRENRPVLVHCYAGVQRSATVVAAYIKKKYGLSTQDAMACVRSRKQECFSPRPTFQWALHKI